MLERLGVSDANWRDAAAKWLDAWHSQLRDEPGWRELLARVAHGLSS
jgi:hypothetical protein